MLRSGEWSSVSHNSRDACEQGLLAQWLPCQAEKYGHQEAKTKKKHYQAVISVQFLLVEAGIVLGNIYSVKC